MNRIRNEQPRKRGESGETLVEVLITMLILGAAISALVAALATSIMASANHRTDATANTLLRSYAEGVKQYSRAGYLDCTSGPHSYPVPATSFVVPEGWTAPTNTVDACGADTGTQVVHISLTTPNDRIVRLDVWVRKV